MTNLSDTLKKLSSLRSINLNFSGYGITNKGLQDLSVCLKRLRSLQSIELDFAHCPNIREKGLKDLGEELHSQLRSVSLNFYECDIGNKALSYLGLSLQRLNSLQSLELGFSNDGIIIDKGLHNLSECLRRLSSLKSLKLSLAHCIIKDDGLKILVENFKSLSSLQSLSIYFLKLQVIFCCLIFFNMQKTSRLQMKAS